MTPYLLTHTLLRLCPTKPWRSGWHTLLPGMLCCLGALHSPIQAQELYKQGTVTFDINSAEIDPARDNNRATIADINLFVEKAATDSNTVVSDICIGGYASPEGPAAFNTRIAQARMQALRRAIILGGVKIYLSTNYI